MQYLYHFVPKNMTGTVLYPLNELKEILPDIYFEEIKKYEGREELLKETVSPLTCLWNDVIHLTAITPEDQKKALIETGCTFRPTSWFKIPVSMIEGTKSAAFTYDMDETTEEQDSLVYETFNPERMPVYSKMPEETLKYYKHEKNEGKEPFLFHLVPHILYKGAINVSGLEIVAL